MIAPVPVTADSPSAATSLMPAATAAPAASFGDLLMLQLVGAQAASAAPGRSAFPSTPSASIPATTSLPAGGKNHSAAPIATSKLPAGASGDKKAGEPAGQPSAVANLSGMPVVAATPPTLGSVWSTPAVNDGPNGRGSGRANEGTRPSEAMSQFASTASSDGLHRGDGSATPSANDAWPMPVSKKDALPVDLPGFPRTANQSSGSQNAAPMFAAPVSDGGLDVRSLYRSGQGSPTTSPASASTAASTPKTEDVSSAAKATTASSTVIRSSPAVYAEQSPAGTATTSPAAAPQGRTVAGATASRSTTSWFAELPSPLPGAVATTATTSDIAFPGVQTGHPAIAAPDTHRPASAAAASAMAQNELFPSLPSRTGSTAPASPGAGVRTVPPLRGPDENFRSTYSVDRDQPVAPPIASETQTPAAALANPRPAASQPSAPAGAAAPAIPQNEVLHPFLMRSGIAAPTGTPPTGAAPTNTAPISTAGAAAGASPIDTSDSAQKKATAAVSPAIPKLTVPTSAPAARIANPTADETASPSSTLTSQPASPGEEDAGTRTQPNVAAAPARPVASAPASLANPAPAKAEAGAGKPAPQLDSIPAASKAIAEATKPSSTSSEGRGPASNPAASPPTPDGTNPANPAPAPAAAPSAASGPTASVAIPDAEEANAADSEGTIQVDSPAPDPAQLNPVAPENVNGPGNVKAAAGNPKTGPESSAAAPARVSRKAGDSATQPSSSPAVADSSNQSQRPSSLTPADTTASQAQDKAQPPAAASSHTSQPAAAIVAQPVPLADGRQVPPHSDAGNNGNQAPAASGNIPPDADSVPTPVMVQSARVLERMGQTEMRVGMNTADFGNLELRASVGQDRVGASIATSHLDLRAAMMAEMPSLERSIEQHQLRLDHLDLGTNGGDGSHQRGASAQQQQSRSQSGAGAGFTTTSSSSGDALPPPEGPVPSYRSAPYSSGLNVHA